MIKTEHQAVQKSGQAHKLLDEEESVLVTFLYLEHEIRHSNMPLTAKALKKAIKVAIEEISSNLCMDSDTITVKCCLQKTLNERDEKLIAALTGFGWATNIDN